MSDRKRKQKKRLEREKRRAERRAQENASPSLAPAALPMKIGNLDVIATPAGVVKISAALLDVLQPIRNESMTLEEMRSAMTLGVIAWNLAIFPLESQARQLKNLTEKYHFPMTPEILAILGILVIRKQQMYPDDTRMILRFWVTQEGDELNVQVAATLPNEMIPDANG